MKIAFFLLLSTLVSLADIREVKTMAEALEPVDKDTLLIFDIDNTIVGAAQTLGSDQWFEHHLSVEVAKLIVTGKTPDQALKEALPGALKLWKAIQMVTSQKLVEPRNAKLITEMQRDGVKVMGLTARPADLIERTRDQLLEVGVDLNLSTVTNQEVTVSESSEVDFVAKFSKGILHCGNNKKGSILLEFFKRTGLNPKKIVFVDDKLRNVQSVEQSLNESKHPMHISFRYGAADAKVAAFDRHLGATQLEYFGKILSDDAARKLNAN